MELSPYVYVLLYLHQKVFPCHLVIVGVELNSKALFGKGVGVSFVTIHYNFSKKTILKHSNFFTFYIKSFTFYYYSNKKKLLQNKTFSLFHTNFSLFYTKHSYFFFTSIYNLYQLQYLSQSIYQTPPKSNCHYI